MQKNLWLESPEFAEDCFEERTASQEKRQQKKAKKKNKKKNKQMNQDSNPQSEASTNVSGTPEKKLCNEETTAATNKENQQIQANQTQPAPANTASSRFIFVVRKGG